MDLFGALLGPMNPFGLATVPAPPAICCVIYDAVGVGMYELPVKPQHVVR
jgi:CO/xanthine dehydrogenase Mo-binding subunit